LSIPWFSSKLKYNYYLRLNLVFLKNYSALPGFEPGTFKVHKSIFKIFQQSTLLQIWPPFMAIVGRKSWVNCHFGITDFGRLFGRWQQINRGTTTINDSHGNGKNTN
jgi:hypothetical protein